MQHPHDMFNMPEFASRMVNPAPLARAKRGGKPLREFQEFALRGSVLDMAIGIILGVAFGKIITSFVEDFMMPMIGFVFGKVDFSNLFVSLTGKHFDTLVAAKSAGAPTLNYGLFMNAVFNFVIVALGVFLLIRQVNRFKRAKEAETTTCPFCAVPISAVATRCPCCTSHLQEAKATAT